MKVIDLANEFKVSPQVVLEKLKAMKLKAKDSEQELSAPVVSVLKTELLKNLRDSMQFAPKPKKESISTILLKEKEKAAKAAKAAKESAVVEVKEKPSKAKKGEAAAKATETKEEAAVKAAVPEVPAAAVEEAPKTRKGEEEKPAVPAPAPEKAKAPEPSSAPVKPEVPVVPPAPVVKAAPVSPVRSAPEPFVPLKPLAKKRKKPGEMGRYDSRRPGMPQSGPGSDPLSPSVPLETVPLVPQELQRLEIKVPISVKDFAVKVQQKPSFVLKELMLMGVIANINETMGGEIVEKLAAKFGFAAVEIKTLEQQLVAMHEEEKEDPKLLKTRAPVVTFMGHVDHGKTSLLDRIRKSNIADQEHGGITQHIGAYSVAVTRGRITFLDTPGHEAFTAMRARGAHLTDLVVLVVAADEGIMPQTVEAVDHARAAKVPIVVAMNKIDRRGADPDKVKKQLSDIGLVPEDWWVEGMPGKKTIVVGVSAITGEGVDALLEMILLESEMLELKANYDKKASGVIVEANLSQGRGVVGTMIVQSGTLHANDFIVVGPHYGKVKAMFDDHERAISEAGPSTPVEILGLPSVPEAGEMFYVVADEKSAREITERRQQQLKDEKLRSAKKITLEDLYTQIQEGKIKELNVILKADVQGSLEALQDSLEKIPSNEVKLRFIHQGVGDINASDVILAVASQAIIIGFHVDVDTRAKQELEKNDVDVRLYRIIYDAVNDMRKALEGLLEPKTKKKFVGRVEIRQVFKLSKAGIVAGSFVVKGRVHRKVKIDLLRNGQVIHTGGTLSSLKRFKDDVREVGEGFECGLTIEGFEKVQEGDVVEAYELETIARTLE